MSIYFSGSFSKSSGVISAITKQLKGVNLKPVKRIEVKFDPFHEKAINAREFLFHISNPKIANTNLTCLIKANVVCDRSEPEVNVHLQNKSNVKFLASNLSVLEILQQFNKHISSQVKEEDLISATNSQTNKIEKKKNNNKKK